MANFVCHLQESCPHFDSGDNKPPNHHVRVTVPCKKYLADSCEMSMQVRVFFGETVACDIAKVAKVKKTFKKD